MNKVAIVVLSLVTALTGFAPAQAFPIPDLRKMERTDVENVSDRRIIYRRGGRHYGGYRGGYYRGGSRRYAGYRGYRRGYYGGYRGYYGGYRGFYGGYRSYYDDWAVPFGAFAAGAILGGALYAPRVYAAPPVYSGAGGHVQWCYSRYRSYRAFDNTFQPYHGPRRQCYSPYG